MALYRIKSLWIPDVSTALSQPTDNRVFVISKVRTRLLGG